MKKSMERLRVRIDQNLNRSEKSEALSTQLLRIEETISTYKQVCQTVHKKLGEGLPGFGKGTDGPSIERRLKKTADFNTGQQLVDAGRLLIKQNGASCLGQVLVETGGLCTAVGSSLVQYELSVEQLVLGELDLIIKRDLPVVAAERKILDKLVLDLDTVKSRLDKAREEEHSQPGGPARVERLCEELDDVSRKVEQARDQLSTTMMTFMSREVELASLMSKYLSYKCEYHQAVADQVRGVQPRVDEILSSRRGYPIFGTSLHTHLESFAIDSGIAYPLQLCINRLMELGLEEEGLFRIAAGSSKVKRLRAEFEAGLASPTTMENETNHHLLTAIIKSYLRELPEPILGSELYSEWVEASTLSGDDLFDTVWNLLQSEHLPRENYRNIHYLFKFLNAVTKQSEVNKMTASNLAIVITPNVLWECEDNHDTMDVTVGNSLAMVVELIIDQVDWFFQNDPAIDWSENLHHIGPPHSPGEEPSGGKPPPTTTTTSVSTSAGPLSSISSSSTSSPVPTARDRKFKGKKAPAPPPLTEVPGHSQTTNSHGSPSPPRHNGSHPTPPATPHQASPAHTPHHHHPSLPPPLTEDSGSPAAQPVHRIVSSHPPCHPPPQVPPNHPPPKPPLPAVSQSPLLYPDLNKEIEPFQSEPGQDRQEIFPDRQENNNAMERGFPVPAPRTYKPALPSKPEGLSRNVSMRATDPVTIMSSTKTKESKESKESTNL